MMASDEAFVWFARPHAAASPLSVAPQLESWDAKSTPSQQRLAAFLDHLGQVATPRLSMMGDALALELVVGLDADVPLTGGGRDIDNYLYPVVRHLGWSRFVSAHARKCHGTSSICVAPAMKLACPSEGWQHATAATTASAETRAWKDEVDAQIRPFSSAVQGGGPIELCLSFRLSAQRNWSNLWKPALDSLGSILGDDPAGKPFHPRDDRVVAFSAHRHIVAGIGNRVEIGVWWRALPASAPRPPASNT